MNKLIIILLAWYFLMPFEKQGAVFSGNALDYKEIGPFSSFALCDRARQANIVFGHGTIMSPRKCYER